MSPISELFQNNRVWAERVHREDPEFFVRLTRQQQPEYLWIGCSDSRVPANQIVDLPPGRVFVHRNVANLFVASDLNALSVLQFAVDVLGVRHAIVCGHYSCSGVRAALIGQRVGLADNWLRHVRDVRDRHRRLLDPIDAEDLQMDRLCEINVLEQVRNLCQTTVVQDAWERGQSLSVHGFIYSIADGLLRDLGMSIAAASEVDTRFTGALARLT